jgi:hypothetical protein
LHRKPQVLNLKRIIRENFAIRSIVSVSHTDQLTSSAQEEIFISEKRFLAASAHPPLLFLLSFGV